MIIRLGSLFGLLLLPLMGSTKAVYPVWQPISLHGTDVTSVSGGNSNVDFGVVMSRPVVLSGALPEALVYAVALGHELPSIGTYTEKEANLLVLYNIKVEPKMDEEGLTVVFNLSGVNIPEDMEVNLRDAITLSIKALKMTLQNYAEAHLHKDLSCAVSIGGLTAKNQTFRNFGETFLVHVPERVEVENPLPENESE